MSASMGLGRRDQCMLGAALPLSASCTTCRGVLAWNNCNETFGLAGGLPRTPDRATHVSGVQVLVNGPGTCIPICAAAFVFR